MQNLVRWRSKAPASAPRIKKEPFGSHLLHRRCLGWSDASTPLGRFGKTCYHLRCHGCSGEPFPFWFSLSLSCNFSILFLFQSVNPFFKIFLFFLFNFREINNTFFLNKDCFVSCFSPTFYIRCFVINKDAVSSNKVFVLLSASY